MCDLTNIFLKIDLNKNYNFRYINHRKKLFVSMNENTK